MKKPAAQQKDRQKFIAENMGLVHSCAHRFQNKGIEYEELVAAGNVGLVKATDGFDHERGVKFSTYAVPVILGEIRRLFRDGGSVKVSRSLKERAIKITKAREEYFMIHGTEPTVKELAESTEYSREEVVEAVGASTPPLSLTQQEDGMQIDLPVDSMEEMLTNRIALAQALSILDEKDTALILLRYFRGMTQAEIASKLGMTQVQVSRREKKILASLRLQMKGT